MNTLVIELLTVTASGLLAGALVTEAMILVPYWKRMPPEDFQGLHHTLAPLLFRFYAPLTVAGTLLPVLSCTLSWLTGGSALIAWSVSALCGLTLLGFYFGYFRSANQQFEASTSAQQSATILATWAKVHGARTVFAVAGFMFASLATALAG